MFLFRGISQERQMTYRFSSFLFLAFALLALNLSQPAAACTTSQPPPPGCGMTLSIAEVPPAGVLPSLIGAFTVPTLVYFELNEFPAGSGSCPAGPYEALVVLNATCNGISIELGATLATVSPGFNNINVPALMALGSPGACTLNATAEILLPLLGALTAKSSSTLCLAEQAPGLSGKPRLDIDLLGPAGTDRVRLSGGDMATYLYRLTNNDSNKTFTGEMVVELANISRLPELIGIPQPGTGVFSVSDPVAGDNFPLAFAEDLTSDGRLRLPEDSTNPSLSRISRAVQLAPGQSIDIPVHTRPWGLCAHGSTGQGKVLLQGTFSDLSSGIACTGFTAAVDTSVPSAFHWRDCGQLAEVVAAPGATNRLGMEGMANPTLPLALEVETVKASLKSAGMTYEPSAIESDRVNRERGRMQVQFTDPQGEGFDPRGFYELTIDVGVAPEAGSPYDIDVQSFKKLMASPTGMTNRAPIGQGLTRIQKSTSDRPTAYFELFYQLAATGVDTLDRRHDMIFSLVEMTPKTEGDGFTAILEGMMTSSPILETVMIQTIELAQDVRGFFSEEPQIGGGLLFLDSFEGGNLKRWSTVNDRTIFRDRFEHADLLRWSTRKP